jgi:hypothetical protein
MSRLSPPAAPADVLSLEAWAEQAGFALACPFSSSAEFDAALIASRRAAGVYGPRRSLRLLTLAAVAAALALIVLLIV